MKNNIPLTVLNVINDDTWSGGPLIRVKDQITRPAARELAENAMWLLPMVRRSPAKARLRYIYKTPNMTHVILLDCVHIPNKKRASRF